MNKLKKRGMPNNDCSCFQEDLYAPVHTLYHNTEALFKFRGCTYFAIQI